VGIGSTDLAKGSSQARRQFETRNLSRGIAIDSRFEEKAYPCLRERIGRSGLTLDGKPIGYGENGEELLPAVKRRTLEAIESKTLRYLMSGWRAGFGIRGCLHFRQNCSEMRLPRYRRRQPPEGNAAFFLQNKRERAIVMGPFLLHKHFRVPSVIKWAAIYILLSKLDNNSWSHRGSSSEKGAGTRECGSSVVFSSVYRSLH
jgi:hypothetical protein